MATRLVSANSATGKLPDIVISWLQANLVTGSTLVYSNNAYPARPSGAPAGAITYVGPVQPTTWLPGDEWRDIS